jgi:hypothetical protein
MTSVSHHVARIRIRMALALAVSFIGLAWAAAAPAAVRYYRDDLDLRV